MGKVLVSLDDTLLGRIDRRAEVCGVSRSRYLASLVERDLAGVEGQGASPAARGTVSACLSYGRVRNSASYNVTPNEN